MTLFSVTRDDAPSRNTPDTLHHSPRQLVVDSVNFEDSGAIVGAALVLPAVADDCVRDTDSAHLPQVPAQSYCYR